MTVLSGVLTREIIENKTITRVFGVSVFVTLTMLGAFVRIPLPFTPVPVTLQTFFVLLSGLFLGRNLGGIAQVSYVLLGIAGLPFFTGTGSGIFHILGPTGGYLAGFVAASFYIGRSIRRAKEGFWQTAAILLTGDCILLCCGVLWLKLITGFSFFTLFCIGFIPFIPGDILKVAAAAVIYRKLKPRLKEIF
ncbi:MAG: biotin transporter BioY [Candidatus Omnitrophota bacterium]